MLANNLPEQRKLLKLTQEDLAELVGVSRQTIIAIERGNYSPSLDLALRIARVLTLPIEKIFYLS